jgi:P2-related tail formation protein
MSTWIGTWDVEQKAIVGTFPMEMVVWEEGGEYRVEFNSEKVVARVTEVRVEGEALDIHVDLTKPLKAKAVMELSLTGPDTFDGNGRIRFMPNSTYTGVRRRAT